MIIESLFDEKVEMLASVRQLLEQTVSASIERYGNALLALSGGSSPRALYQSIAQEDWDWSNISIALVDERWVPSGHSASNEDFIKACFMPCTAKGLTIVGLKNQSDNALDGLELAEQRYHELGRAFDFTLLGMGLDGHTASWFPYAAGLEEALADSNAQSARLLSVINARMSDITGPYTERITLNKHAVLSSGVVALMISGEKKLAEYKKAKQSEVLERPVATLLQQTRKDIHVFYSH